MAQPGNTLKVLSLSVLLAFTAACHRQEDKSAPPPQPVAVDTPAPGLLPDAPEVEAPEPPEPTKPAIDMAPASAYIDGMAAALKKHGYTGHMTEDLSAPADKADTAANDDSDDDAPNAAATALKPFSLDKQRDIFTNTPKVFRDFVTEDDSAKSWLRQITVLGDIRADLAAEKDDSGKVTSAARKYGNFLSVIVSSGDDAESTDDVTITVYEGWGYTDGSSLVAGGLDDLSDDALAKFSGVKPDDDTPDFTPVTKQFSWAERGQAEGAILDWMRDNTSGAKTKAPAADKVSASWIEEAPQGSGSVETFNSSSKPTGSTTTTPKSTSGLCVGVCAGPHIDLRTGKLKVFGTGPGYKF